MKRLLLLAALSVLAACGPKAPKMPADAVVLRSPDGQLELKFAVVNGVPEYTLDRNGKAVVLPSRLGYALLDQDNLDGGFTLTDSASTPSTRPGSRSGARKRPSGTTTTNCS